MGNIRCTGLPEGIEEGSLTITTTTQNYIKFMLNAGESQYECVYDKGSLSSWTPNIGNCIEVKYAEILEMRNNGKLIPGVNYRITDYDCVTFQRDTKSAHNQFDIIVTADDERTLNENARAINHKYEVEGERNVSYVSMKYGSSHQIYFTSHNGENCVGLLFAQDDENYYWLTKMEGEFVNVFTRYTEGFEPIYVDYADYWGGSAYSTGGQMHIKSD